MSESEVFEGFSNPGVATLAFLLVVAAALKETKIVETAVKAMLKDIEQEWDILLGKYRSQVWTEFKDLEERKELQQQWNSLVKEAFLENQKLN